jgi:ribosomal protein S27AE
MANIKYLGCGDYGGPMFSCQKCGYGNVRVSSFFILPGSKYCPNCGIEIIADGVEDFIPEEADNG